MFAHFAPSPLVIGLLSVLLASQIGGALYLFRLFRLRSRFYKVSEVVDGVVIQTRRYPAYDSRRFFASVSYAVAGTEYMLKDGLWTRSRRYRRGECVKIRYLPDSPADGCVEQRREPVLYLAASIVLLIPIGISIALLVSAAAG